MTYEKPVLNIAIAGLGVVGSEVALASFVNSNEIICQVPPGDPGAVAIAITINGVDFVTAESPFMRMDNAVQVLRVENMNLFDKVKIYDTYPKRGAKNLRNTVTILGTGLESKIASCCFLETKKSP